MGMLFVGPRHWRIYPFISYHTYSLGDSAPFDLFRYNYLSIYKDEGKVVSQYQLENRFVTDVNVESYHIVERKPNYDEDLYIKEYRLGYEDKILNRTYLDSKNDTLRKEVYRYVDTKRNEFECLRVWKKNTILQPYSHLENKIGVQRMDDAVPYNTCDIQSLFRTQPYKIISGTKLLSEKEEISYIDNKPSVASTITYGYDDKNQLIANSKSNSEYGNSSRKLEYD